MKAFADAVVEVLLREGPLTLATAAKKALKLRPLAGTVDDRWNGAYRRILDMVAKDGADVVVVEEPSYRLGSTKRLEALPAGRRLRAVLLALSEAAQPLSLRALMKAYDERYGDVASNPLYEMYVSLEGWLLEPPWRIRRIGSLRIGLRDENKSSRRPANQRRDETSSQDSISRRLDEKSLETLLENRPELLEAGLTIIKRQFAIKGVGRIDLLGRDRMKNLVVIEIKRPSAGYREIVGQITAYMGWVRRNMAEAGQGVRGIIVVGRADERLKYSLESVRDVIIKPYY